MQGDRLLRTIVTSYTSTMLHSNYTQYTYNHRNIRRVGVRERESESERENERERESESIGTRL